MEYLKIIDDLITKGNDILLTTRVENNLFAQLSSQYSPEEWVDTAEFNAWRARIISFFTTHFDETVVEGFKSSWTRGNKPSTVKQIIAMLQSLIIQIENNEVVPKKGSASLGVENTLLTLFTKFHRVARQLRTRHNNRSTLVINDEYDVQDLLHAILLIHFDNVIAEEWTPSYAGGSVRVDFLLKNEKIVIEVKKTRQSMTSKKLGEELIIDIEKYAEHPYCEKLFCFVYDPEGILGNPSAIMNDLNNRHKGFVQVIIRPEM